MKATPGPWNANKQNESPWTIDGIDSRGQWQVGTVNREGDAHLIATAPELLEACKVILEQFRNQEGELVHGHCSANFSHMEGQCNCGLTKLQQAIAKAEGAK